MDPPVVDKPSAQAINRILAYVQSSSKHQNPLDQEVGKMIEVAKKASIESETCSQRSPAARASNAILKPNTASTESPSAACRLKRLKRKAEFDATKHAKTLRGPTEKKFVDECSQVPSMPSFKDMTLDQLATYNQKCFCSLNSQCQVDKEELERVMDSLKTEVSRLQDAEEENLKERVSLQGEKEELEKVNASFKAEVSRLQSAKEDNLKDSEPYVKVFGENHGDQDDLTSLLF